MRARSRFALGACLIGPLVVVALSSQAMGQDFGAGRAAYNRGNYAEALGHWRPLAERNDPRSQAALGFMYFRGLGVSADDDLALNWFRRAAEKGQVEAQFYLGMFYFHGRGVARDVARAFMWCELALTGGYEPGLQCRQTVTEGITPEQLSEGARLAAAWHAARSGR